MRTVPASNGNLRPILPAFFLRSRAAAAAAAVRIVTKKKSAGRAVAYLRVSSREQGKSGLGLEAQKNAIERFCAADGCTIAEWFTEVESGKRVSDTLAKRPQLAAALNCAKQIDGPVIVAKLDRLSRDVHFVSGLMVHGVEFIACDLGRQSDSFVLHLFAALAEKERAMISERTTEALAALKRQGARLGSPTPQSGGRVSAERRKAASRELAAFLMPLAGNGTWEERAARLNAAGYRTAQGKKWTRGTLFRLFTRALPDRSV